MRAALRRSCLRTSTLVIGALLAACAARHRLTTTSSGLAFRVLAVGRGPVARAGQQVSIHETTRLPSGGLIYTSRGGAPITFQLGGQQVIAGVDEGVTQIRPG
jgi:FKBP-type peptidyl-prolyl cis-trans isomerase